MPEASRRGRAIPVYATLRYFGRRGVAELVERCCGHATLMASLLREGGLEALLVVPGFVTDALGVLLLFPLTRKLTRRWISRHYAGRKMSFVATAGRFAPSDRGERPADVESTVLDDDRDQLGR